ncbi:hypothetical protein SNEBB_003824 [Seison nebaliae]|nr:hypothetical protein SNEBB_003824 [Seison nebaliae]
MDLETVSSIFTSEMDLNEKMSRLNPLQETTYGMDNFNVTINKILFAFQEPIIRSIEQQNMNLVKRRGYCQLTHESEDFLLSYEDHIVPFLGKTERYAREK